MLENIVEECIFRTGTHIYDGLRIHNHGLRATSVTHQKQEHMTDREVMTASRHKSTSSVAHYDRSGKYAEVWDKCSAMFTALPKNLVPEKQNEPESEMPSTPIKRKFKSLMEDGVPEKEEESGHFEHYRGSSISWV